MKLPKLIVNNDDKKNSLYNTWWNMICRCYIPLSPNYENYGARGINVDKDWFTFVNFLNDMGLGKKRGLSLDRLDNNLGYSKSNCTWSNRSQQMLNRRTFGNNTTGETGVTKIVDRYEARFHYEGVRYRLGRFDTITEAKVARLRFIEQFKLDKDTAIATVKNDTLWCTSTSGVRGVTKHKDGGYIVRYHKNGTRIYVGYFKTYEEAVYARRECDKS